MEVLTKLQTIILKSAERVFNQLGRGYPENIYQKALLYELYLNNMNIDIERNVNVIYKDTKGNDHVLTSNRIDLFIHNNESYNEGNVILELKATKKNIDDLEIIQIKKYFNQLENENIKISYGIIINFSQNKDTIMHQLLYPHT